MTRSSSGSSEELHCRCHRRPYIGQGLEGASFALQFMLKQRFREQR
jgi:hypothetical protein